MRKAPAVEVGASFFPGNGCLVTDVLNLFVYLLKILKK